MNDPVFPPSFRKQSGLFYSCQKLYCIYPVLHRKYSHGTCGHLCNGDSNVLRKKLLSHPQELKYEVTLQLGWPRVICDGSVAGRTVWRIQAWLKGKYAENHPPKYPALQRFIKKSQSRSQQTREKFKRRMDVMSNVPKFYTPWQDTNTLTQIHHSKKIQQNLLSVPKLHQENELSQLLYEPILCVREREA